MGVEVKGAKVGVRVEVDVTDNGVGVNVGVLVFCPSAYSTRLRGTYQSPVEAGAVHPGVGERTLLAMLGWVASQTVTRSHT